VPDYAVYCHTAHADVYFKPVNWRIQRFDKGADWEVWGPIPLQGPEAVFMVED